MNRECTHDPIVTALPRYEDRTIIGFRTLVLLDSVQQIRCSKCEAVLSHYIPDQDVLEHAVALTRVQVPVQLNGAEVRFLRTVMDMKAKDLATVLQVDADTVSKWENGHKAIGPNSEKLLRLIVCAQVGSRPTGATVDVTDIVNMDLRTPRPDVEIVFNCRHIDLTQQMDWRKTIASKGWKTEPKLAA